MGAYTGDASTPKPQQRLMWFIGLWRGQGTNRNSPFLCGSRIDNLRASSVGIRTSIQPRQLPSPDRRTSPSKRGPVVSGPSPGKPLSSNGFTLAAYRVADGQSADPFDKPISAGVIIPKRPRSCSAGTIRRFQLSHFGRYMYTCAIQQR